MAAPRSRRALSPSLVSHWLHFQARRDIHSKTAVRRTAPKGKSRSSIAGAASSYVEPVRRTPTPEHKVALNEVEEEFKTRSVAAGLEPNAKAPATPASGGALRGAGWEANEEMRIKIQSFYGQPMTTIALSNRGSQRFRSPRIHSTSGCDFIASFNLDTAGNISVPGEPPRLSPSPTSLVSLRNSSPISDWTPPVISSPKGTASASFFTSVQHLNPTFRFGTLDIFSSVDRFLAIIHQNRAFTATILPGGPMILNATRPRLLLDSSYPNRSESTSLRTAGIRGRDFESAITRPVTSQLPSKHFRAISYKFGRLSMGFINEIDAWDPITNEHSSDEWHSSPESHANIQNSEGGPSSPGRVLPSSELVEIKTTSRDNLHARMPTFYERAWYSRIERLCVGIVRKDDSIQVRNTRVDFSIWESKYQQSLLDVHAFLFNLRAEVAKTSSGIVLGIPHGRNKRKHKVWELYEVQPDQPLFIREIELAKKMIEHDAGVPKFP